VEWRHRRHAKESPDLLGGGHGDYNGNELYALDLNHSPMSE